MGKRRWHVVTVGRDVGVFETWLETGILVKGVPEAIYQSFATEQEARSRFEQEYRKGNVRIVLETTPRFQRRAESEADTFAPEAVYRVESTASAPSSLPTRTRRGLTGSDQASTVYQSATEPSHTPNNGIRRGPPQHVVSQPTYTISPVSRAASEPSGTHRRHQSVEMFFEQHQGDRGHRQGASNIRNGYGHTAVTAAGPDDVGAGATLSPLSDRGHRVVPASRPSTTTRAESVRSTSPSLDLESQPRIVCKTPSWLGQYPKGPKDSPSLVSSGLLSPLSATNFPLNSVMGRSHTAPSTPRGRQAPNMMGSPSTRSYLPSPHYPGLSTIQSAVMDPRSPIDSHATIPELTYVQPLSFSRPSPSNRTQELLPQTAIDTPPRSSLLLRPQV